MDLPQEKAHVRGKNVVRRTNLYLPQAMLELCSCKLASSVLYSYLQKLKSVFSENFI